MPITFEEHYESRKIVRSNTGSSAELKYIVRGTHDEVAVKNMLATITPATYDDLVRGEVSIDPVHIDSLNPEQCIIDVTVRYVPPTSAESSEAQPTFSFDTSGGTQHITQAVSHVASYAAAGKTPADFHGAIGVTKDSVEGVDITVPIYAFSETHYLANSLVTSAYKGQLFTLTGKTNNAAFKGCAAGECLFLGASGSQRGGDKWEINFRFAASPNKASFQVGGITVAAKKGWDYMWVRYEETEDAAAFALVKRPVDVHVDKVYEEGNFALLGIGT